MDAQPDYARMAWPDAKVAHYCPEPGPATHWTCTTEPSISEPSSVGVVFAGRHKSIVSKAGRSTTRVVIPGTVTLCGPEPIHWLGGDGTSEFIEITASPGLRRETAVELGAPEHAGLDDLHSWDDPVVWTICARFRAAARGRVTVSDVESDTLLRLLYARVLERKFGAMPSLRTGGLDRQRLGRVLDFIEAHAAERLTIASLADIAALSPYHFIRAFRNSTGVTPHRYVMARRLENARKSLASGSDIRTAGKRAGYRSVSHFRSEYAAHFGRSCEDIRNLDCPNGILRQ